MVGFKITVPLNLQRAHPPELSQKETRPPKSNDERLLCVMRKRSDQKITNNSTNVKLQTRFKIQTYGRPADRN